jgi:hypothetical protein
MHPQLQIIREELLSVQNRLHRLRTDVPEDQWPVRSHPERWSVSECVAHLNLTSAAFQPLVQAALTEGRRLGKPRSLRYRRDFTGWILWRFSGPPPRFRSKTPARFIPDAARPPAELIAEFDHWQAEQLDWVRLADGLPLNKVRIRSPFDARVQYNLYSGLSILPRHQHRHLWQAEQVWAGS